jgi:hypothetical protein
MNEIVHVHASNRKRDLGESARLMVWGSGSKQHFPSQSHSAGRKYMSAFPPLQCFWVLSNRPEFHTKAKNYDCFFNCLINPDPACGSMRMYIQLYTAESHGRHDGRHVNLNS